jgi:hypothetical protein
MTKYILQVQLLPILFTSERFELKKIFQDGIAAGVVFTTDLFALVILLFARRQKQKQKQKQKSRQRQRQRHYRNNVISSLSLFSDIGHNDIMFI